MVSPTSRACRLASHLCPAAVLASEPATPLGTLPGQQLTRQGEDGYAFTHSAGQLSTEERDSYERNGYLLVKGNLPKEDLERFREHFARLCTGDVIAPPGLQVVRDLGAVKAGGKATPATMGTINKVQNLEGDPVLSSYGQHPNILRYLPAFTGPGGAKVLPFTSMLVNKPPDAGLGTSRHPLHQDLWFFPVRPASKVVCGWTALQRITRENGALFVVPGTHRTALRKHVKPDDGPVNAGFVGIEGRCNEVEADSADVAWLEMEPGDTVFFHPLLHHGSGRNTSTTTRQAISMHYVGTDCTYFDPRLDPVQAERWKRIAETGGRQYGDGDDTEMVEMYKKRLRGANSPNSRIIFGQEGEHDDAV